MIISDYRYLESGERNFRTAFEWLRSEVWKTMAPGTVHIDGDEVYAFVQEYSTKDISQVRYERHHRYADIQMIADGHEFMYVGKTEDVLGPLSVPYKPDVEFYGGYNGKGDLVCLTPGIACVLYPEDAHLPGFTFSGPVPVRKVVVKVSVL